MVPAEAGCNGSVTRVFSRGRPGAVAGGERRRCPAATGRKGGAAAGLTAPERILERLTEETSLRATLVGNGAGIVHSRLEELSRPVAALGVLAPGRSLHLGATLQFVVDVIFLVLSPVEPPEPHLELVAAIAALVRDEAALNLLRGAGDAAQAIETLTYTGGNGR